MGQRTLSLAMILLFTLVFDRIVLAQAVLQSADLSVAISQETFNLSSSDYVNDVAEFSLEGRAGHVYLVLARADTFSPQLKISFDDRQLTADARRGELIRKEFRTETAGRISLSVSSEFDTPRDMIIQVSCFLPINESSMTGVVETVKDVRVGSQFKGRLKGQQAGASHTYRFRIPLHKPAYLRFDEDTTGHFMIINSGDKTEREQLPAQLFGRLAYILPVRGAQEREIYLTVFGAEQRSETFSIRIEEPAVIEAPAESVLGRQVKSALIEVESDGLTRLPEEIGEAAGGGMCVTPVAVYLSRFENDRRQMLAFGWDGRAGDQIIFANSVFGNNGGLSHECAGRKAMVHGSIRSATFRHEVQLVFVVAPKEERTRIRIDPVLRWDEQGQWECP